MSNQTPRINIHDIITSLLFATGSDEQNIVIPDGLIDLSHIVTPLRAATNNGRAFDSTDEFGLANFLGKLLNAFLPRNPTKDDLTNCVLGLTLFLAMILRTIPENYPDTTMEEFLIDAANQDAIIRLARTFSATPVTIDVAGKATPNIAQFPIFHSPTPLTIAAIRGFIQRRIITPLEQVSQQEPADNDEPATPNVVVNLSDINESELIADSMNGFDEMYDIYFESEKDEENDDEDPS